MWQRPDRRAHWRLYSCDHFVEPEYLLGNIRETHLVDDGGLTGAARLRDGQARHAAAYCVECTCPLRVPRRVPPQSVHPHSRRRAGLNYLCAGYLSFFTHVDRPMRIMADLVRQGRYADEVMAVFAEAGRNEPCPCGSGRKAKSCHQR